MKTSTRQLSTTHQIYKVRTYIGHPMIKNIALVTAILFGGLALCMSFDLAAANDRAAEQQTQQQIQP